MKVFKALLIMIIITVSSVLGQTNSGRLVGTVSDASGVIPGATVIITDNKTGRERTVVTNDDGTFTVTQLEFGSYTVKVSSQGHKTYTANDVKIDVGREYSLNVVLDAGDVNEQVTVVAGTDVVNASNGELSNSVSPRQIQELPLNGRNPLNLITLQAGTASNGAQETSINGQRPSAPNITLDGLNIQDNFIRANASGFTQVPLTTDAISEFTVTTQNAGAEQGVGSAQIQLVTPRGQNDFHGSTFWFNRNSKFAANPFFNNGSNIPRAFRNFNQFGGKLGGPIVKNKVFFFGYYEGLRDRLPTPTTRTVLTQSARQGIFTYTDLSGARRQVNLFSLPIGGTNPPTGINPLIQSRFLANIPLGNTTLTGDQRNTTGYQFNQKDDSNNDEFKVRLDYDINERHSFNLIYDWQKGDGFISDFADTNGFTEIPAAASLTPSDFYTATYRWTASKFVNEVRAGYVRNFPQFPRTTQDPAQFFGLPLVTNPESTFLFQGRKTKTYTFQDNADYQLNQHSLRFGFQYNYYSALRLNRGGAVPTYNLGVNTNTPQITAAQFNDTTLFPGGIGQTDRGAANALYAFLGGIVSSQTQTFNVLSKDSGFVPLEGFRQDYAYKNAGLYFSDQWRVTPRLTLNLGLRYEVWPAVRERNGVITEVIIPNGTNPRAALLDPNGGLQVVGGNAGDGRLFFTDKNNFAPIISVAFQPEFENKILNAIFPGGGKTVFRGGYRISYFNDEFLKGSSGEGDQNPGLRLSLSRINLNERAGSQGSIATPTVQVPRTFAQNNAQFNNFGSVAAVDPHIQVPRNHEYNFSIQREIGWNTAIEIRYVGAYSPNATRYTDQNPIDIESNGFLPDFLRARQNLILSRAANQTNPSIPISPAFNPAVAGSQQLTVFPRLGGGGQLTNNTVIANLDAGLPSDLALFYIQRALTGDVRFLQNPNLGLGLLLSNSARYNYNSLQFEVRRKFAQGLYMQANYTFQKTLTNAPGTDQRRFEFQLDPNRDQLEYSRATYDQTHVFNLNSIYELPFGKGKTFFTDSGPWLDRLVGGWQFNSIVSIASGAPFGIFDPRGSFSTTARSTRNTANSSLTKEQIKDLIGIFRTPNGIYFINPSVIDPVTGRAANGLGSPTFNGQVFFNVPAGQIGQLERFFLNGPMFFNIDASLFKNIQLTEQVRVQFRAEAFNLLNRTNFFLSQAQQAQNINSANFGKLSSTFSPRVVQFAFRLEF